MPGCAKLDTQSANSVVTGTTITTVLMVLAIGSIWHCRRMQSLTTHEHIPDTGGCSITGNYLTQLALDIQSRLYATGIEHQPGPGLWLSVMSLLPNHHYNASKLTDKARFVIDVGNITKLSTHSADVCRNEADALVFQEHSCPPKQLGEMFGKLRKARRTSVPWYLGS